MKLSLLLQIITKSLCSRLFFLKFISNYSQCEQRLYLEIEEEEEEENVGYLFFFCFSTLYLFAAGGTLMMPFQNGHIIFKKPLVNNFRVAYVDTNCYSPHLPSPQQCTVQSSLLLLTKKTSKPEGKNLLVLPEKWLRPLQFDRKIRNY